jgi:hypothetical protein
MDKSNGFGLWLKKEVLLFRYHFRSFRRRALSIPQLAFAVSLVGVFALVLFPSLRTRLRDAQDHTQSSFHVSGSVSEEITLPASAANQPIHGAIIEVGGARTISGADGSYDLEFRSENNAGIPVIYKYGKRQSLERIDFPEGSATIRKDYVFK